jgi:hypothetical protein
VRSEILGERLGQTRKSTRSAMSRWAGELPISRSAEARTDPAELTAVDALVRHQFELPSLDALSRLAASVHAKVNAAQW